MRVRVLALCAAFALTVGVATAAAGGKSTDTAVCHHGGWTYYTRADGTAFTNQRDCVSYVSQGGTLEIASAGVVCAGVGGTLGSSTGFFWTCTYNYKKISDGEWQALVSACVASGGDSYGIISGDPLGVRTDGCQWLPI